MDVELRTRRLLLRQPGVDDVPRIARYLNNFHVAGNLSRVPYPYCEADAHAWLRTWRSDRPPGETGFILELPGEGLIGHAGLHPDAQGTVIGYWLGEPFWNRGFMTEAVGAIVDWYFEATRAVTLGSGVFSFNGVGTHTTKVSLPARSPGSSVNESRPLAIAFSSSRSSTSSTGLRPCLSRAMRRESGS